jgi:hypothetical protein
MTQEVASWLQLYREVASIGFPAAMFFLLLGSYMDIWGWTKVHRRELATVVSNLEERIKEWQSRCEQAEQNALWWRNVALKTTTITETVVTKVV